jgi:CRP-like cAMP-binding protein
MYGPDEYFGVAALLASETYRDTAEATEDTSLCLLPKNHLEELFSKFPEVAGQFIKLLANNVLNKEEQLLQLAYHSVRKRMSEALLRLVRPDAEAPVILNISRDNLAAMAGMATETVSRILSDFKDEGLIERKAGSITILNQAKLANMKN